MNTIGSRCCYIALRRNKTSVFSEHDEDGNSIMEEVKEFLQASETKKSLHLPQFTEAQEELADIIIACMTELYKRGVDIDDIISKKIAFNETRT